MSGLSGGNSETRPVTWKIGLAALIVSFFWSGNIISIKFGLETIPPIWSAFWRMSLGAVCVTAWALARGQPVLFERGRLRQLLMLAVVFIAQIIVFNLAVHYTSPAYAVILLNTNPVMINLISHFFMKDDRLTLARLVGLGVAFCGISYVMLGHPDARLAPNPLLGNSLMLLSSLLLAIRVVHTQHVVRTMDPLRPVIWPMVISLPCFLILARFIEPPLLQPLTAEPVFAIVYQAVVVAGFCFVAWSTLLQHHSAGNLAVYSFSVPVFGLFLSAAFFGEQITGRLFIGATAVAAGIAIVTHAKRREARS